MKTSNLINISADRSAQKVVDYNLQDKKTEGSWRGMDKLPQYDLISFNGDSNMPGLSIHQKGALFKSQAVAGAKTAQRFNSSRAGRHKTYSQCHTIVQSFEFEPNPKLKPEEVHQMGNELYHNVQSYMKDQYGYNLNSGIVSTHIDRDQDIVDERSKVRNIRHPHLHNHIILPGYNSEGKSISPYLRKNDIYHFQHINDEIGANHDLHDYYFAKLWRQIYPFSAYSMNEYGKPKKSRMSLKTSNVQRAWIAYKKANDYAWDKNEPMKNGRLSKKSFAKTLKDRDDYLRLKFHFHTKTAHDSQTHKKKTVFTMGDFSLSKSNRQQWYNLNNMRILRWRNRKEMRAERILWQFDFRGLLNKSVSFNGYRGTIQYATNELPDIGKVVRPNLRQQFQVHLASAYRRVEKAIKVAKKRTINARIKMTEKYKKYMQYGKQLMNSARGLDDSLTNRWYKHHRENFLVKNVNGSANRTRRIRLAKRNRKHLGESERTPLPSAKVQNYVKNDKRKRADRQHQHHSHNQGINLE